VADFNWKRIKPWRREIAACFDDPAVQAIMSEFDKCRIEYAADPTEDDVQHKTARASLIAGWMASCVPRLRGRVRLAPVVVAGARAGRIGAVLFQSTRSQSTLSLNRQEEPLGIAAEARDARGNVVRTWMFAETRQTEAMLLHRSIDDPARDSMFEAALAEE
jgi:glucose-6-phosphate dehydrogenase assembly protein OpcA